MALPQNAQYINVKYMLPPYAIKNYWCGVLVEGLVLMLGGCGFDPCCYYPDLKQTFGGPGLPRGSLWMGHVSACGWSPSNQ